NPDRRHRDWNLDTYGGAVVAALEAACAITDAPRASICALCSGGIVSAMVAAYLNRTGRADRLASLCLGVTVLDQSRAGTAAALAQPGKATMLGSPVDLSKTDVSGYVVAGVADHLCPWQACYRSARLLGGPVRFILSTSGHIASMVNPPGNPKATFQTAPGTP